MQYDQDAFAKLCSSKLTGRDRIYASNRKDGETIVYELIFQTGSKRRIMSAERPFVETDLAFVLRQFEGWKQRVASPRENWVEFEEYEDGLLWD